MFQEIYSLGLSITSCIWDGYVVRGALTHGLVHLDTESQMLIGPAFIRAYELESREAVFPRVIIDPKTIKEYRINPIFRADHHDFEEDSSYVFSLLRLDTDGYYFVDYLKAISTGEVEPPVLEGILLQHKELVERNLLSARNTGIQKKYSWLGNYHNAVVQDLFTADRRVEFAIPVEQLAI